MNNWHFIYLLHNLSLKESIEYDYIAIVPSTDERVIHLIQNYETIEYFVNNFTDQFGRKVDPSILVVRDDAPKLVFESDALVGLKNAIAISFIIFSWQNFLTQGWQIGSANYSNYFDIYPISPNKNYDRFTISTPSVLGSHKPHEPREFCGQSSAELAKISPTQDYDSEILDTLLKKWKERYINRKTRDWSLGALFRSLEMAYHACSIPFENNSTIRRHRGKSYTFDIIISTKHLNSMLE